MMAFFEFAFQDIAHWLGVTFWILITAILIEELISTIADKFKKNNEESEDNNK